MVARRCVFFVLCCLATLFAGPDLSTAQTGRIDLPEDVGKIFKKHCVECHGKAGERASDLKRAKGDFDFIYDVSALLSARTEKGKRFIVPGDPGASLLFELIESDEMPEEANLFVRPALEDDEKAAVRKWIEALSANPAATGK